jgi:hypothetical protein
MIFRGLFSVFKISLFSIHTIHSLEIFETFVCILKAHSHSKSGGSIWASLECQCCFWIAGGLVSYLTMWLLILQLLKNSIDTQGKLRLNLHSLSVSVSELSEYRRLARFSLYRIAFRSDAKKHLFRYGMYNFQKLSETTSLRCNNSSENRVPKRYGWVFFTSLQKAVINAKRPRVHWRSHCQPRVYCFTWKQFGKFLLENKSTGGCLL